MAEWVTTGFLVLLIAVIAGIIALVLYLVFTKV
jgi:hypothetical protein